MDRPKSRLAPVLIVAGALLLIAYPFSIGPAFRLMVNDRMSDDTFNMIYAPINASYRWEPMRHAVVWYLDLWHPEAQQ